MAAWPKIRKAEPVDWLPHGWMFCKDKAKGLILQIILDGARDSWVS